jgi:catechol 2,3-dioxygenase-like lactoylglutathione lyase family enzyme
MATAIDAALVKFHASLNVSDIGKSVAFYRVLLGVEPAKVKDNYAKFDLAEPPLVLSLIPGRPSAGGHLNHAGLRVRNAEELVAIQRRLEMAGLHTEREDGVECCYAKQTKFWVTDPDKALWEVYVFHEDVVGPGDTMRTAATLRSLREHGSAPAEVIAAVPPAASAPEPAAWTHRLTDALPSRLPADDGSLDEVHLQGSINAAPDRPNRGTLFAEIRRALRAGASLHIHGLAGDRAVTPSPRLPGPAAAVEFVPAAADVVQELAGAGFVEVRITTLSVKPPFVQAGVPLREVRIEARTPAGATAGAAHRAVYKGPMAQVTDDFGNVYRRGAITAVAARDWEMLSTGPLRDAFLFLGPEPVTIPVASGCCTA